ncbi:MAG: hypothetical protein IPM57_07095 [Oligoflexia bacterium]|nr:hypothetical protein [Oligoflexia bacterium]
MAILTYVLNDETLYRVRVQMRSTRFPSIRFSEQESGIKTESEAKKIESRFQKEGERWISDKELQRRVSGLNWGEVLDQWYQAQSSVRVHFGSISQTGLDDYYGGLKKWMCRFQFTPCADITSLHLMEVFNEMSVKGISIGHRKKMRRNIKSVFDFGIKNGLISSAKNPAYDLV